MDDSDLIWNRALGFGGEKGRGAGDLALSNALSLHGLVMNGGLLNAVEIAGDEGVARAVDGYRWLGLDGAASAVTYVHDAFASGAADDELQAEALEREGDERYNLAVPNDATIEAAFRDRLRTDPDTFDAL